MYCSGQRATCINCGKEAYDHTHNFVLAADGVSVNVSVDNACSIQEAAKEAIERLSGGISDHKYGVFDLSSPEIGNPMTCLVRSIEFEGLEKI